MNEEGDEGNDRENGRLDLEGEPPEVTVALYDEIEMVNGTPGCAECGCLLAVEQREGFRPTGHRLIAHAMLPRPVEDIERIQCACCGRLLWTRAE